MTPAEEVAEQSRALRARLQSEGKGTWEIVEALLAHHLEAAHRCAPTEPELAIAHLREVEHAQRAIASTATAGGEGLQYMGELYRFMAERARLHERLAGPSHDAEALRIWEEIAGDPNGLGDWAEPARARAVARVGK